MNWLTEPFRHEFMQRALFGCALIGFTNGVLSAFIVLRRLALMADAMAHSLLPGVSDRDYSFRARAGQPVLRRSSCRAACRPRRPDHIRQLAHQRRHFARTAVCSFSLGLVLLSFSPSQVNVTHYLFGNILGLADGDLWIIYFISLVSVSPSWSSSFTAAPF